VRRSSARRTALASHSVLECVSLCVCVCLCMCLCIGKQLWNTADGSLVGVFRGHRRGVWSVAFSPVDVVLATSSADKTIKLWSLGDFACLKVRVPPARACASVCLSVCLSVFVPVCVYRAVTHVCMGLCSLGGCACTDI
jgi:hypothetical protein